MLTGVACFQSIHLSETLLGTLINLHIHAVFQSANHVAAVELRNESCINWSRASVNTYTKQQCVGAIQADMKH